jgi:hypothetical protein
MVTIESTEKELRVIIPRGEMEVGQVEAILRPFKFLSLVADTEMTKDEARRLSEESKANWWKKNRGRFQPPGE